MKKNKSFKNIVVITLLIVLVLSVNVPSLASMVYITNHEVESNDNMGNENLCMLNTAVVGNMNVPNDVDRFSVVPNGTANFDFLFFKQSGDQTEYLTFILDENTGTYIKPLSKVVGNVERLTFKPEWGHSYTLLVTASTSSTKPYQFVFYQQ